MFRDAREHVLLMPNTLDCLPDLNIKGDRQRWKTMPSEADKLMACDAWRCTGYNIFTYANLIDNWIVEV